MKQKKILIVAGGSGGHLLPAQQLALSLQENADVLFAGHRLSHSLFFQKGSFSFCDIEAAPLSFSLKGLIRFCRITVSSTIKAISLIRSYRPDRVVGFGSYHSFPILLAAFFLRKKISLFEANCQLGKVNRLFSFCTETLFAQFPFSETIDLVPLLPWKKRAASIEKTEALLKYGLRENRTTCLIFGGSQGADFFNRMIPLALPDAWQAIHITGKEQNREKTLREYQERNIPAAVLPYEPEMERAYLAADLVICRSGASTLAELIGFQLPALLIPYPYSSDNHQLINGEFLAKKIRGATMLLERDASLDAIKRELNLLMEHRASYQEALRDYRLKCEGRKSLASQILGE